ncbi:preprotein translocase subunit SecG [Elusimicrobiota bacterium]
MVIHIVACALIIVVILLQSGKSGGFQGIFGSSGEVIFSTPSGSSFMRKATAILAITFAVTSLSLVTMTRRRLMRSVTLEHPVAVPQAPAQPQQSPQQQKQQPPAQTK